MVCISPVAANQQIFGSPFAIHFLVASLVLKILPAFCKAQAITTAL
jgi:hypothetical protein